MNAEVSETVAMIPPPVRESISYTRVLATGQPCEVPTILGLRVTPLPGGTIGPDTYRPKSAGTFSFASWVAPLIDVSENDLLEILDRAGDGYDEWMGRDRGKRDRRDRVPESMVRGLLD